MASQPEPDLEFTEEDLDEAVPPPAPPMNAPKRSKKGPFLWILLFLQAEPRAEQVPAQGLLPVSGRAQTFAEPQVGWSRHHRPDRAGSVAWPRRDP